MSEKPNVWTIQAAAARAVCQQVCASANLTPCADPTNTDECQMAAYCYNLAGAALEARASLTCAESTEGK